MKEKIEIFKNEKIVVNVRSQKQYDEFMKMCEEQGLKWGSGDLPTKQNIYNHYKENTCINLNNLEELSFDDIGYYKNEGHKTITYEDFIKEEPKQFTKSDLKDNHIMVLRDKTKHIWKDFDFKVTCFPNQFKEFNNDLTHNADGKADIMEVWEFETLVWKREEKPVEVQELIKYKNAWEELKEKTLYEEPYDEYYDAGGTTTFEEVFSVFKELEQKHGIKEE